MKLPLPLLVALIVLCAALVVSTTPASGGVDCRSGRNSAKASPCPAAGHAGDGGGCTAAVALPFLPFDTQKVCMAPAAGSIPACKKGQKSTNAKPCLNPRARTVKR